MATILFNITEEPVKKDFICWLIKENFDKIELWKMVNVFYPHPQAPEHSTIPVIEQEFVRSYFINQLDASYLRSLKDAGNNVSIIEGSNE